MRFPDRSSEGDSAICSVRPSATKANSNTPREIVASQAGYEWSQQCFSRRDWIAARGSIHIRFGQGGHSPFLRPQKFCVPCGHRMYTYTRHHGSPRYQPTNAHSSTTILPKITDPLRTFFRNDPRYTLRPTSRKRSIPHQSHYQAFPQPRYARRPKRAVGLSELQSQRKPHFVVRCRRPFEKHSFISWFPSAQDTT